MLLSGQLEQYCPSSPFPFEDAAQRLPHHNAENDHCAAKHEQPPNNKDCFEQVIHLSSPSVASASLCSRHPDSSQRRATS